MQCTYVESIASDVSSEFEGVGEHLGEIWGDVGVMLCLRRQMQT